MKRIWTTLKILALLFWLALALLAAVGWAGRWYAWQDEDWQVSYADGRRQKIDALDSLRLSGLHDGAVIRVRRAEILSVNRMLTTRLSWNTYDVQFPDGFAVLDVDELVTARRYPLRGNGYEHMSRMAKRFPVADFSWPPTNAPHGAQYSFVRAKENYRHGFDLEIDLSCGLIVIGLLAPVVLGTSFFVVRRMLRGPRRAPGCCPICNYDLRSSTTRCPECGHPIHAA